MSIFLRGSELYLRRDGSSRIVLQLWERTGKEWGLVSLYRSGRVNPWRGMPVGLEMRDGGGLIVRDRDSHPMPERR
jgi:hypothetical protein